MRLEDELVKLYQETYPLLYEVLPKIFYLLIDGVDIKTIESCFAKLKQVLSGQISTKSAENALMAESSEKYKLPTGFWDPMIKKG
jgi:predicted AAA+ superfamily ATPase